MNKMEQMIIGQKSGQAMGMYSICSANSFVLDTCMESAKQNNSTLLIEATSNQVNQLGGYTGLTPMEFGKWIKQLCQKTGFKWDRITLGGDHLGPTPWQNKFSDEAMKLSEEMVYDYAAAGFQKIHLDASMPLIDDDWSQGFEKDIIAKRTVQLALAAEQAVIDFNIPTKPFYVIGSEVPIAGGMQESDESVLVSQTNDVQETLEITQKAFFMAGLCDAWERVIAIVVRSGVEFGDQIVYQYHSEKTIELSKFIEKQPQIIFEAHSTDYQSAIDLQQMVKDHFGILKVGPALSFAFREAVFSLSYIENELIQINKVQQPSKLIDVLDNVMQEDPTYWIKYYTGDENELKFARKFSLSDRSRYYWKKPQVKHALNTLLENLSQLELPWSLVNQFFPDQENIIKSERDDPLPKFLIANNINKVINAYIFACGEGMFFL